MLEKKLPGIARVLCSKRMQALDAMQVVALSLVSFTKKIAQKQVRAAVVHLDPSGLAVASDTIDGQVDSP